MTNRVIQTFTDIVQIDSPTGDEAKMAQWLVNYLESCNYRPYIDLVGNVVLHTTGNNQDPIFLNAHLDTVEPGRGIRPYIENGVIRSKGNSILGADNKTAVAAIVDTLATLSETQHPHPPLDIVFTVAEESGNDGAHGLDYSQIRAKEGYISDASGHDFGDIITASPYYERFDICLTDRPTHASTPELAVNALAMFNHIYQQLNLGRINSDTIANVGIVQCGQVVNTIPGEVRFSGEVRSMVETELQSQMTSIHQTCTVVSTHFGGHFELQTNRENNGFELAEDDPFVTKARSFLQNRGLQPQLIKSWGCYDANIFAEHNLKVINIADGSQNAHTAEEYIAVSDLQRMTHIFYQLITNHI